MGDLIKAGPDIPTPEGRSASRYWRTQRLAALIQKIDPDIIGVVEAPSSADRTTAFSVEFLNNAYQVYQGERRGTLGLAFMVRQSLDIQVTLRTKAQSLKDFPLDKFDADNDGIKEVYNWYNRVPLEGLFSGSALIAPVTFILIHAKSKGVFIPGDVFAYERLSKASRMKLRAQAASIRSRLDRLISPQGQGRVIVLGDMNDSPEYDQYAALLGGAFLEPVMGSVWDPKRILANSHTNFKPKDRWTIDFFDRILNPLEVSRYGQPREMRSWIDHILVSPELADNIRPESAGILHKEPDVTGMPSQFRKRRATDHHPPYVEIDL